MEKKKVTVSIVVPVYNAGAYIEETVEMVQRQSFTDWELLLVDDASGDDSLERMNRLAKKDQRIHVFPRKKNEGAAAARNYGTRRAEGRYLAFLDADDVWLPEKLERQLAFIRKKDAAFVFTSYEFGDEEAKSTGKVVHAPESLVYKQALSRTVIFTSTTLFDTRKIPARLLQMPPVKSEDTATWWQILRNGYTAYGLDQVLAIYRRPARSLSSNKVRAIGRIWNLYRKQEKLSVPMAIRYFVPWAFGAVLRRI